MNRRGEKKNSRKFVKLSHDTFSAQTGHIFCLRIAKFGDEQKVFVTIAVRIHNARGRSWKII